MPVVTPSAASIETVNAVPCGVWLSLTICFRPSWRQRSSVSVRQIRPRPYLAMKLIASGRDVLGGHHQVALVFAVFLVDQHDHAAGLEFFDNFQGGGEAHQSLSIVLVNCIMRST